MGVKVGETSGGGSVAVSDALGIVGGTVVAVATLPHAVVLKETRNITVSELRLNAFISNLLDIRLRFLN
jgi:hypothetical protein